METKENLYRETIQIWNSLCELHRELYELTSLEYIKLLESNLEKIESSIEQKQIIVHKIKNIDIKRKNILDFLIINYYLNLIKSTLITDEA